MSKAIPKECMALLKEASEMFSETGCVPGIDGEEVPAETISAGCQGIHLGDGPRGRVVGLWPSRTGEGYFLLVHVGQPKVSLLAVPRLFEISEPE
jgi:hypothetical protein